MVSLSVAICTWNRLPYLKNAVASLMSQTYRDFEILIVDNGSTDGTLEYVRQVEVADPRVRVITESNPGVSYARNRSIEESRGKILAFLDDDSEAAPDWVEAILATFHNNPEYAAIGGKIEAIWDESRPLWLDRFHLPFFTVLDFGDEPIEICSPKFLVGTNLAFRRDVLGERYRFSAHFGRVGTHLLSCEEEELQSRMEADGLRFLYDPRLKVAHHLKPSCLRLGWLLRRYFWHGYAMARLNRPVGYDMRPSKIPFRFAEYSGFFWSKLTT